MAAKQLSDGKGNFLPSFHLPLSTSSNVEPTSDNSPSERSYDVTACHRRHSETLTHARPRPGHWSCRQGPSRLAPSPARAALILEISGDTSRKEKKEKRCVMHVLCSQPARERGSGRPTRITNGIQFHLFPDSRIRITACAPPPNETVIEGCARPRRSITATRTHIAGKMILSNQKWSLSIRDAYLVLIGTGPFCESRWPSISNLCTNMESSRASSKVST